MVAVTMVPVVMTIALVAVMNINFKSLNKTQHQEYGSSAGGHIVIFCRRDELVYASQLNMH